MLVVGLSGGPDLVHENRYGLTTHSLHDAACVLIEDGVVLNAIEEERVNRIKHTNKFPSQSLTICLKNHGVCIEDVDLIAYYLSKEGMGSLAKIHYLTHPQEPWLYTEASFFQHMIQRIFASEIDAGKFRFVDHHLAHAMSAYVLSGYESGLIVTIDGFGDGLSGTVSVAEGGRIEPVVNFPTSKSLGILYSEVIRFLGYHIFDEYKVMGLAPYGDPGRYRDALRKLYTLLPHGGYDIHNERVHSLYELMLPRRKWEPLTQMHKDLAAALQESLEEIVFHVLRYNQQKTKQKNLCLAGGVVQNCTLNGKILYSGLFENIFVQPASHDAGCALGAALSVYYSLQSEVAKTPRMNHVYWGTHIGSAEAILSELMQWQDLIEFEKENKIVEKAADLISAGSVIGWVQGKSEFGPRALGNRSILADPRPAENKDRINQMIKRRESYRPFAPSVLEEDLVEYFEVPANVRQLPFMIFVVKVKEEKRKILGAVTHVDGTARVQTVSRTTNEKFWDLIHAFKVRTGVSVLLNTSFNNNVEPIVDSVEDAIVCFLTTKLDYLVVGDYLITKREADWRKYLLLKPSLPAYISLYQVKGLDSDFRPTTCSSIRNSYKSDFHYELSDSLYRILMLADGKRMLGHIIDRYNKEDNRVIKEIVHELIELWSQRLITLRP
jgi:carbamoyltransferase